MYLYIRILYYNANSFYYILFALREKLEADFQRNLIFYINTSILLLFIVKHAFLISHNIKLSWTEQKHY